MTGHAKNPCGVCGGAKVIDGHPCVWCTGIYRLPFTRYGTWGKGIFTKYQTEKQPDAEALPGVFKEKT